MTANEFYNTLKDRFRQVLKDHQIENEQVTIICRALTPEETIGKTRRQDFPIISGKDIMIEAAFRGSRGQAFTDAPSAFSGPLSEILEADIAGDARARGLFIATVNAVMCHLGLCCGTVHCRTEGPELCAGDLLLFLRKSYADRRRIALIGYQPAMLEMLSNSEFDVRVLDLNPVNIGQIRYGVTVEHGVDAYESVVSGGTDLILCTGSTVCNGTIVNYLNLDTEVLFFGTTLAGPAVLMELNRVCFAQNYS
ncbi:MAG: hypothetical protein IJZ39_07980 [Oscillospiraceae bacterium]|nr:hypothetical protein [Oscillospiraceae bacterium]